MPKFTFGQYQRRVFHRNTESSTHSKHQTLELNTQDVTIQTDIEDLVKDKQSSVHIIYNCDGKITPLLKQSILPGSLNTAAWVENLDHQEQKQVKIFTEQDISATFPTYAGEFTNVHFNKKMRNWFLGIPGFEACLSFTANYDENGNIAKAIKKFLESMLLNIDGKNVRLIPQGVEIYHGPVGRKKEREIKEIFPVIDPLSVEALATYSNMIFIGFKFVLAEQMNDVYGIKKQHFHYGSCPAISISLNIRLEITKTGTNSFTNLTTFIADKVQPFSRFIADVCMKTPNLTSPSIQGFGPSWQAGSGGERNLMPVHASREVKEEENFEGLVVPAIVTPDPVVYAPVVLATKKAETTRTGVLSKNYYALLAARAAENSEDSAEEDDVAPSVVSA